MAALRYDVPKRTYDHLTLIYGDGRKVRGLFTNDRLEADEREKLVRQMGLHVYEFRQEGNIPFSTLELYVFRNHSGTFITPERLVPNGLKELWEINLNDPDYHHANMGKLSFGKKASVRDVEDFRKNCI